jgi:hypothetical protein
MEEIIKNLDVDKKIIENILLIFKHLSIEPEIYKTKFGTVILDWENGDNIFSLEIAKQSFGYFIEIGGKHYKTVGIQIEELDNRIEEIKNDFKTCNIN